jgi:hypothetical protein
MPVLLAGLEPRNVPRSARVIVRDGRLGAISTRSASIHPSTPNLDAA